MKRTTLTLLALGAAVFVANTTFAADEKPQQPAAQAPKEQKVVKVLTLNNAKAIQEFEANVQLVQAQRLAAEKLNTDMQSEKDVWKKAEMKKKLDDLMKQLNDNNQQMIKHYGFSLTRNYIMQPDSASVYMVVSDEEAAKFDAEQKAQEKKK